MRRNLVEQGEHGGVVRDAALGVTRQSLGHVRRELGTTAHEAAFLFGRFTEEGQNVAKPRRDMIVSQANGHRHDQEGPLHR